MRSHFPAIGAVLTCFALISTQRLAALPIEWVTVGDPGNTPHFTASGTLGGVGNTFQMGRTEITNAQYVEFLNAVDFHRTNTLGLYKPNIMTDDARGGILNSVNDHYAPKIGRGDNPVIGIDWFDAIRFANWQHNGRGVTDAPITESGAYTILGGTPYPSNPTTIVRNPGATFFVPSINEWYKAAYYKGGNANAGYWTYPTKGDAQPYSEAPPGQFAPVHTRSANYFSLESESTYNDGYALTHSKTLQENTNYLTDAGAYTQTLSPYGTFDQAGNVWEWTEDNVGGNTHTLLGGSWNGGVTNMTFGGRLTVNPLFGGLAEGFRIARAPFWSVTGGGSWSSANNWLFGSVLPNSPVSIANFHNAIQAPSTITLDGNRNVGAVNFNSDHAYNLASGSGGGLTMGGAGSPGSINVLKGSHQISAPLLLGPVDFGANVTFDIFADAALTISGPLSGGTGVPIRKFGNGTLTIAGPQSYGTNTFLTVYAGTLNLNSNPGTPSAAGATAFLEITGGPGIRVNLGSDVDVKGLFMSFAAAGRQTLDLNSTAAAYHSIRVYDANLDGTKTTLWNAIRNANAPGAADPLDGIIDSGLHASAGIGIAKIGDHILIRATRVGDLNLDGMVSIADFLDLASHFNAAGTWQEGDLNGDGLITISDFLDLASNFNSSYSGEVWPISVADQLALSSFASEHGVAVPEPGMVGLAAIVGAALLMPRPRGRKVQMRR